MVLYKGQEIAVRVDLIVDKHLLCTRLDTMSGLALTSDAVRAGPLEDLKSRRV